MKNQKYRVVWSNNREFTDYANKLIKIYGYGRLKRRKKPKKRGKISCSHSL